MAQMTTTVGADSLLDEAEFFAELEGLERGMTTTRQPAISIEELPAPARTRPLGKFADDAVDARRETPAEPGGGSISRVVAVGFVVLMAVIGAAGAALAFHDRVALILSRIQ
jgi:hypothetical protein